MAVLDHIEKFQLTFSAGSQSVDYTLITPVTDVTKTAIFWGASTPGTASNVTESKPSSTTIALMTVTTTTLTFIHTPEDTLFDVDCEIIGYIVEFSSGVIVERGVFEPGDAPISLSSALSTITDIDKSFVTISWHQGGSDYNRNDFASAVLTEISGDIYVKSILNTSLNSPPTVYYQVIQYDDCSVQHLATFKTFLNTDDDKVFIQNIDAVDLHRTFLLGGHQTDGQFVSDNLFTFFFSSREEVVTARSTSTGNPELVDNNNPVIEIVSFTDNTLVQQRRIHFSHNQFIKDIFIQSISDPDNTICIISNLSRFGRSDYINAYNIGETSFTADVIDENTIRVTRGSALADADVTVFIIEFESTEIASTTIDATLIDQTRIFQNENVGVWKFDVLDTSHVIFTDDIRIPTISAGRVLNIKISCDSTDYDFSLRTEPTTLLTTEEIIEIKEINENVSFRLLDGYYVKLDPDDNFLYFRINNRDSINEIGVIHIEIVIQLFERIPIVF